MSLTIEDPEQALSLRYESSGRLLEALVKPGAGERVIPLLNPHHAMDVYSIVVNVTFSGEPGRGWAGTLIYSSSFGPGHCATLSEHDSAGMRVEPGFMDWPQRPGRALPVLRVAAAQPGNWTMHHT